MKNNKGMGHIKTIMLTIIIAIVVAVGVYFVRMQYEIAKVKTIKTNMSNIELKTNEYLNKQKAEGKEKTYIGTKVVEIDEEEAINLINEGIIAEEEKEQYYVLSDEDLEELGVNFTNEKNSFYMINYENKEIVLSSGCKINNKLVYKYSEIKQEDTDEN